MQPSDYKALAAWGRLMQSFPYYITQQQEQAAADNAPVDAIYKRDNEWHRLSEVAHPLTIRHFELNEPELFAAYMGMQPLEAPHATP
jgi:hypothetical protein